MALPGWIGPAAQVLGGLIGRKKSRSQKMAEALQAREVQMSNQMLDMAQNYDPAIETNRAIADAQRDAGRFLKNTLGQIRLNARAGGGDPDSGTQYGYIAQRAVDDSLNSLSRFAAESRAANFAKKLTALQSATQSAAPGDVARRVAAMDDAERLRVSGNTSNIVGGVNSLLGMIPGRSTQTPGALNTLKPIQAGPPLPDKMGLDYDVSKLIRRSRDKVRF